MLESIKVSSSKINGQGQIGLETFYSIITSAELQWRLLLLQKRSNGPHFKAHKLLNEVSAAAAAGMDLRRQHFIKNMVEELAKISRTVSPALYCCQPLQIRRS